MNLFRIGGIQLAVHASFFLLLAFFGFEGWREAAWQGMWWSMAMLVAFFACVVLHELGHSFMALHFGIGVRRILLLPIGGMAEFDAIPREPRRELLITIAGPAVNFVIAALLWPAIAGISGETWNPYSFEGLLYQLFAANLVMGVFNLLPAFPMDGGRILRALLARRLPYLRATWIAASVGKTICIVGIVAALGAPVLGLAETPLWMLAVLFSFIFVVGELEYRMVRRRELDEQRWRLMLAELQTVPPAAEEPPLFLR